MNGLWKGFRESRTLWRLDSSFEAIMDFRLRRVFRLRRRIFRGGLAVITVVATVVALLAPPLSSQTTATGALTGEFLDPSGAVIPDATLCLIDQSTSRTLTATSSDSGRFSFLLPPGSMNCRPAKPTLR